MFNLSHMLRFVIALAGLLLILSCAMPDDAGTDGIDLDEMVLVPAGEFIMGSDLNWKEEPPHTAYTEAYWIDKYEVTVSEYAEFVEETGHRTPQYWFRREGKPPEGADLLPIVNVDYFDACAYCEWEEKRIPTEAEWEKAARGADGQNFPWGSEWNPDYANTWEKGPHRRSPVNAYSNGASPYGVLNMGGNVWEWTSSWLVNYPGAATEFDFTDTDMILKGGSWLDFADSTRSARRHEITPYVRFNTVGFRCVKDTTNPVD